MKITMTADELLDNDLWDKYCEITGTSEWAISEGQIQLDEELEVPPEIYVKNPTETT